MKTCIHINYASCTLQAFYVCKPNKHNYGMLSMYCTDVFESRTQHVDTHDPIVCNTIDIGKFRGFY